MEQKSKKNWWFLVFNGLIAIFFDTDLIRALLIYIGIGGAAVGVILLLAALRNIKKDKHAGMLLFESILTVIIGLVFLLFPSFSMKFILVIIGVWAVILGVVQLAILVNIKEKFPSKNILLFNGILTTVLGVMLFFDPVTTAGFLLKLLGVFAIIFGILMIYFGFVLKTLKNAIEEGNGSR